MEQTGALKTTVCGIVILLSMAAPSLADTHYVSTGQSIQAAINAATNGDQIEVAPGTYHEAINFNGKAVRLYSIGGAGVTTINGNGADHVVQCVSGEDANTVLDGFTITGGVANGSTPDNCGGGMYNAESSPTVTNCTFSVNSATYGGGMYNKAGSNPAVTGCTFSGNTANYGSGMWNNDYCSPTVTNCIFSNNNAGNAGGGMFNGPGGTTVIVNCIFINNTAGYGAGMWNYTGSPTIINSIFSNNHGSNGGGMYNEAGSNPTVTNCTFSGNTSGVYSGGILNINSNPVVTNCILWKNTPSQIYNIPSSSASVTYSDVEGGFVGTGNIDADPCFADIDAGLLYLEHNSPCIDAGDSNVLVNAGISQDIQGLKRFVDVVDIPNTGSGPLAYVDMGAHEYNWFKKKPLVLNDINGVPVSFSLSGGGWGEVTGGAAFHAVILHDTVDTSVLKVLTKGKTETSIGNIFCPGPLKGILAKTTDLRGDIIIGGPLGALTLDDVADGHTITIGPSANEKAAVTIKFDEVSDLTINSSMPVKSLTVTGWDGGALYAPSVGSIIAKGDKKRVLSGDLTLDVDVDANIGTVKAKDTIFGDWTANSIKSISAIDFYTVNITLNQPPDAKKPALGSLTATSIYNSHILSQGNIGKVTAGDMSNSNCFAGVANGITGLPDAVAASFDETATIKSIAIKGIKTEEPPYYNNSNIAAANILSASIMYPGIYNGGVPFGLTADYIKKLTIRGDKATIILPELDSAYTKIEEDFEIRVK